MRVDDGESKEPDTVSRALLAPNEQLFLHPLDEEAWPGQCHTRMGTVRHPRCKIWVGVALGIVRCTCRA